MRFMVAIRSCLQHRCNAAHVLCRLRGVGLPPIMARRLAAAWEWMTRPMLYGRGA